MSAFARSANPTTFVSHTSAIANPSRARSASSVTTARTLVARSPSGTASAKSRGSAVPATDATRTVAPIGRSAWTKVSAVNAVVRATDLSHGHTTHHAMRPKTTNEKKV